MVTQAATDEVVQWAVGGSALMVTDVQTFTAKLLPVYFKHSSMRSFTRQLNNYGFSRESELGTFKRKVFGRSRAAAPPADAQLGASATYASEVTQASSKLEAALRGKVLDED